ncbi:phage protein Gp36 family protein [Campylobacter sp. 7477a]|uniref:phage protein Gp36 family protein n=1 Tax=Campylobacter sp. 7477a TaxID=2735741 RepID=UPI003014437D
MQGVLALPLAERTWFVREVKMISNDDLLKEVSLKELTELSDFEGSKSINQAVIDDSKNDALAYIGSFVKIPVNPTHLLKDIAVNLTVIELKKRNNFPKEALKDQLEKIDALLLKMASKKIPTEQSDDETPTQKLRAFRHIQTRIDLKGLNG